MQSATWLPISLSRSKARHTTRVLPSPGFDRFAITPSPPSRFRCHLGGYPTMSVCPITQPTPETARGRPGRAVEHWPRQTRRPMSSTTQTELSVCETSSPTNRAMSRLHVRTAGRQRPDRSTMRAPRPRPRLPDVHTCTNAKYRRSMPVLDFGAVRTYAPRC